MSSESPAQRFARLVIAAFESQALTTDELVKRAGGPSNTYMTGLRKAAEGQGDLREPRSDTYRRIERAANWRTDTARLVWRGSDPDPVPVFEPAAPWQKAVDLPRRRNFPSGLEGYVERIADRLLDLEEHVDHLERQVRALVEKDDTAVSILSPTPPGRDDFAPAARKTGRKGRSGEARERQDEQTTRAPEDPTGMEPL